MPFPARRAGHRLNPSEVPYRANIYALEVPGARRDRRERVWQPARSACRATSSPINSSTTPAASGQFLRRRHCRARVGAHRFGQPERRSRRRSGRVRRDHHRGGAFINTIEGPRFSTRAESTVYRAWGCDIIGMTASPEAFLAREAEIDFAVMAHVTDYDVWHDEEEPVTVDMVIQRLHAANLALAQQAIASRVDCPGSSRDRGRPMKFAVMTASDRRLAHGPRST